MADAGPGLRHFWFEFDLPDELEWPRGTREGIGVTARDRGDALELIAGRVFAEAPIPTVRRCVADVEFHRLCPWLVLPNMSDPEHRGVWYPVGYVDG